MNRRQTQTAYDRPRDLRGRATSIADRVANAMYRHLREDLGLAETVARTRTAAELSREIPGTVCDELERLGLVLHDRRVLDLGAGLGGLSAEIATRGGRVIGVEPGRGWRMLAAERLATIGRGHIIGAVGESLPLASNSIDLFLSLQVLEHVQSPAKVVREAFRVLKPGGYIYVVYENYLSFWEPHYQVRWLPLLPKNLGAAYLRMIGRSPQFLRESITYTSFPSVRRAFFTAGFVCMRRRAQAETLTSSSQAGLKWRILRGIGLVHQPLALEILTAVDFLRRIFRTAAYEFMQKPAA